MSTEVRFGVVAVENGFITPEQLYETLRVQVMEELKGDKRRLIGQVLLEKGYITFSQIEVVVEFLQRL